MILLFNRYCVELLIVIIFFVCNIDKGVFCDVGFERKIIILLDILFLIRFLIFFLLMYLIFFMINL